MNKLYVTVPLVLLLAFGGIYTVHIREAAAQKQAQDRKDPK